MLEQLLLYPYAFIIPLAIFEGPLLSVACGVGVALGYLNPFIAAPILIAGDILPDLVYWLCGWWGTRIDWVRRFATRVRVLREHLPAIEELWRTKLYSTMFIVKLAWGISAPFIVSAGMAGVSLRRFLIASLAVSLPYLGVLMALGYGVTIAYGKLGFAKLDAQLVISIIGVVFLCALLLIVRFARSQLDPRVARSRSNVVLPEGRH
jgi:membrane-associated protein